MGKVVALKFCWRCQGKSYRTSALDGSDMATTTACDCPAGEEWSRRQVEFLRSHGLVLQDVQTGVTIYQRLKAMADRLRRLWFPKGG